MGGAVETVRSGFERSEPDSVLGVFNVSKTFPGTRALDAVTLEVRRGEIHALLGNNGSGKSTLIKILAGVHSADPGGEIFAGGRRFDAGRFSPADAKTAGLHFVHQVPAVFPTLSVAENLAIGRGFELSAGRRIDWAEQRRRADRLLERFHVKARPETPLGLLGAADRTLVAIARALQDQDGQATGVLILDEPTASLPAPEVERLLETLIRYARDGQTIIYVSHRLDEVLRTSHRMTVLRDGRNAGTVQAADMTEAKLVTMMIGRSASEPDVQAARMSEQSVVLGVDQLRGGAAKDVSFEVRHGEIVGFAGLIGSGASDVLRALFAAPPRVGGTVRFEGRTYEPANPRVAIEAGVFYVPPDRAAEASFHAMSVRANLSGGRVAGYFTGGRLQHAVERRDARSLIDRFMIRAASEEVPLAALSGGNQQKVVLARVLRHEPKLLLLDEPTQGVAVHARQEIHESLRRATCAGTTALVVSSDFDELAALCDRVFVMAEGRIVASLAAPLDSHRLTELAHFTPEGTA